MMKILYFTLTVFTCILFGCATQQIIREDIEWSDFWWHHEPEETKPRALLIGDSILRGYYNTVSNNLAGRVNCDRYATSRSIVDPTLYKETAIAMSEYNHAVIHFNNGLHGWHLTTEEYEMGLRKYVKFLLKNKSRDCTLLYSLSTPASSAVEGVKLDQKRNVIVSERNRVARKIMQENGIQIIDLYGLLEPDLENLWIKKGNLHFNGEGYKLMGDEISERILQLIGK